MTQIHFIVNPISGNGKHRLSEAFLEDFFDVNHYTLKVKFSNHRGHAITLTKASIADGANIIVACGGDGTINEVASTLVGKNIPLGIIPVGSGNGLASNLNIPEDLNKAINIILKNAQTWIDVGCLNNQYFFSNMGFGFDGNVIKNYEASEHRTLYCYLKASIKSFRNYNKKETIAVKINDKDVLINPFLIFISNSNEMGYNVSLTPKASLQDGLLDVVIVPQISKAKMLLFCLSMLFRKPDFFKESSCFQTKSFKIKRIEGDCFETQIDGEFLKIETVSVAISVKSKALVVIA